MMTPKEKAKELVYKMYGVTDYQAKQSAIIAVDEIINSRNQILVQSIKFYEYWQEVKQEIQKL